MAFPTVESVTETSFPIGVSSHPADLPATVDSGDLLVVLFSFLSLDGTTGTPPSGWSTLFEVTSNIHGFYAAIRTADGTEDGSTVTISTDGFTSGSAQVYRITGWSDIEASTAATAESGSPNPPSFSPSWGAEDTLWLALGSAADDDVAVSSFPANYTNGVETLSGAGSNSSAQTYSARRELNTVTEDPGEISLASSESNIGVTVAVRPAGSVVHELSGEVAGTGALGGALHLLHALTGEIAGVGSLSGAMLRTRNLAGSIEGAATFEGNLTLVANVHELSGTIHGAGTLSGRIRLVVDHQPGDTDVALDEWDGHIRLDESLGTVRLDNSDGWVNLDSST